jgi:hypothetical protein
MKQIKLCNCCGEPYEVDDADVDFHVCFECNVEDIDSIGMLEDNDFTYLKGEE